MAQDYGRLRRTVLRAEADSGAGDDGANRSSVGGVGEANGVRARVAGEEDDAALHGSGVRQWTAAGVPATGVDGLDEVARHRPARRAGERIRRERRDGARDRGGRVDDDAFGSVPVEEKQAHAGPYTGAHVKR